MTGQPPAASIKARLRPGMQVDVTNHYLTNPDHPCFGTTRRTVLRVTRTGLFLSCPPGQNSAAKDGQRIAWPPARSLRVDEATGVIQFFGGGAAQSPDDLFLTLASVPGSG